jgi:hypothetical protein
MATTHSLIEITTAATRVSPISVHSGVDITIQNVNNTGYIYVGGEGVTSTDYGYKIFPNHAISVELPGDCELWACGSATLDVAILKTELESGS